MTKRHTKTPNKRSSIKNPFASLCDDDDDDDASSSSTTSTSSPTTTTIKKTKKPVVITPAPWAKNWKPEDMKGWAYCSDDEEED